MYIYIAIYYTQPFSVQGEGTRDEPGICRGRAERTDEAPQHTEEIFPTAAPPEDILMGTDARGEPGEAAQHDEKRRSHGCTSWGTADRRGAPTVSADQPEKLPII